MLLGTQSKPEKNYLHLQISVQFIHNAALSRGLFFYWTTLYIFSFRC